MVERAKKTSARPPQRMKSEPKPQKTKKQFSGPKDSKGAHAMTAAAPIATSAATAATPSLLSEFNLQAANQWASKGVEQLKQAGTVAADGLRSGLGEIFDGPPFPQRREKEPSVQRDAVRFFNLQSDEVSSKDDVNKVDDTKGRDATGAADEVNGQSLRSNLHAQREKVKQLIHSYQKPVDVIDAMRELIDRETKYGEFLAEREISIPLYDVDPREDAAYWVLMTNPRLHKNFDNYWSTLLDSVLGAFGESSLNPHLGSLSIREAIDRNKHRAFETWQKGAAPSSYEARQQAQTGFLLDVLNARNQYLEQLRRVNRFRNSTFSDYKSKIPGLTLSQREADYHLLYFFEVAYLNSLKALYIDGRRNVLKDPNPENHLDE